MGSGSSKRSSARPLIVNNPRINIENGELAKETHEEKVIAVNSHTEKKEVLPRVPTIEEKNNNESSKYKNNLNQITTGNGITEGEERKTMMEATNEEPVKPQENNREENTALIGFCKKYPAVQGVLESLLKCFLGLKEALESGNMASSVSNVKVAERLFESYPDCKNRPNKAGLTDFALKLGIPRLVCDIITHLRSQFPELTTWDRAKDLEQETSKREKPTQSLNEGQQDKPDEEKAAALKIAQDIINNLFGSVLNFSDLHDKFCLACSEAGMVPLYVEMIKGLKDSIALNARFVNSETQTLSKYTVRGKMLSRALGTLHNLSKRGPTRHTFVACEAVGVLIPLLKAEVTLYATKTLLILAYLIDEKNNHLIMADEGPIKFLTNALNTSLSKGSHRYLGFSAAELAEGLTQAAVNDSNKKTIAKFGAIPVLTQMLTNAKDDQETINGCNTLWTLAFDAENRKEIKNNVKTVSKLRELASHKNSEIRKAAAGALWEIEGKEKHSGETRSLAGTEDTADTKHIMISYQWDVQSSMIQLKNRLQADGYKVWMDVDQMGGSTLESMAKAVEDATVVLIGVSRKYKESPNCRSEAEYTFQLHKDIIPLMMEKRYRPDGWLGMVVGTKFWIDCSDKHNLDSSIDRLKKELGSRGNLTTQDMVKVVTADTVDASPGSFVSKWTHGDAKQWLIDLGLHSRVNSAAVKRLNGVMLMRLQDLRKESPEFFFSSIRQDFGLANVFDVLEFTDALEKLVG